MKNSRAKGVTGEREACKVLNEALPGANARRSQQYCGLKGDADLATDLAGVLVEVKRSQSGSLHRWVEKAREQGPSIVLHRRDRERWLVTIDLADLADVICAVVASGVLSGRPASGLSTPSRPNTPADEDRQVDCLDSPDVSVSSDH